MDQPLAVLGSDSRCDVVVGGSRGPGLAYLVCAFPESVEVWPLAAIAFPRWGVVQPHHEILVGSHRITVEHPLVQSDSPLAAGLAPMAVSTTLCWDGLPHPKVFRRQVTIIGESHPSVMRLHGRGLRPCDHAAIIHDGSLWLADLDIDHRGDLPTPPVRQLANAGDSAQVGDITIEMIDAISQQSLPPEVAHIANSPGRPYLSDPSVVHEPTPMDDPASGSDSDLLGMLHASQIDRPITVPPSPAPHGLGTWERQTEPAAAQPEGGGETDAPAVSLLNPTSPLKSDQLTAHVTERLVFIHHSKFFRQRAAWVLACLAGFSVAVVIIWRLAQVVQERWFEG